MTDVKYRALHMRVQAARGKATRYACADCDQRAEQWSQTHGTDGTDVFHYKPRCRPCHDLYDAPLKPRGEANPAAKITHEIADEIRVRYAAGGIAIRPLGRLYGLTYLPTWNILNGKAWVRDGVS